ncbi:hypothetical protein F25303_11961 [Fusarium sp. NRRL 25303]|nr:hypothetical protein F25303_11961 [Fusarium sp. NRRL 25303]
MIKPALDHMPPEPNSFATSDPGKLWEKPSAEVTTGLLSLARTCRVLNNAATPYLYHNIDARGWSEEKITEFLKGRRQLQERSFIRRLAYELDPFPLYTLLCRMPDLQLLSLVDRGSFVRTLASKTQKNLNDLRYLHLESTSPTHKRDISTLENVFEMAPNIKTFAIKSGHIEWKGNPRSSPKGPLANLTCLKLFNVSFDPLALEEILEKCDPLESFIYISQRGVSARPSNVAFALKNSSSTLRYLECCWDSIYNAPSVSLLLRSLKTFERLQTLVLGGNSLSIGVSGNDNAINVFYVKDLDPTSLIELLPASIVEVRIDSKHLHEDMYQPMVVLCQAKQAGSFPELRTFLQSNFDASEVPYTLGDLNQLSERYGVSFKQEARSVFPLPVARPTRVICREPDRLHIRRRQNPKIVLDSPASHRSQTTMEIAQHFIEAENLTDVKTAGEGLECLVYKASSPVHGPVVLRVPRVKVYQNANDPNTDASDLIQQEMKIYKLLENSSVPVPKAYKYLAEGGYPAMLCEYVDDDGTEITFKEMGRVAAMMHSMPLSDPDMKTVALETNDVFSTIEQRLKRRFTVLSQTVPEASSWITNWDLIHNILQGLKRFPSSLLHMDFREVNLRHKNGQISAVIDWTNALAGPAAIDNFRTLEFSQLDENFVKGYTEITTWPDVTAQEECLLRLDAALVLALVFTSEAPDAERAEVAVARVKELSKSLVEAASRD